MSGVVKMGSFINYKGIKTNNIPKILSNLIDAKLIIVDKIKGNKGLCNTYQLFY